MIVRETLTPFVRNEKQRDTVCIPARTRCACSDDEHLGHVAVKHEALASIQAPTHVTANGARFDMLRSMLGAFVGFRKRGNGLAFDEPRQPSILRRLRAGMKQGSHGDDATGQDGWHTSGGRICSINKAASPMPRPEPPKASGTSMPV